MDSVAGVTDWRLAREEAYLVSRIAAGDIGAPVEELYERHAPGLYSRGMRLLGDTALAEELVAECFVRLWRTAGRFDLAQGTVAAYLSAIAHTIAAELRKRPCEHPAAEPAGDAQVRPRRDRAGRIVETLMVGEVMESLSLAHRQVLMLVNEEGLTQSQIADRLGLPLETVRIRLFHGLQALRTALAERGYDGRA